MKEKFAEALVNIIKVKSLITLGITGTVIYLAVIGVIEAREVMLLAGMVFTSLFVKKRDDSKV